MSFQDCGGRLNAPGSGPVGGRGALLGVTVVNKRQRATDNVRSNGVEICRRPSQPVERRTVRRGWSLSAQMVKQRQAIH